MKQEVTEIPEFPLFELDDAEVAFGANADRYYGGGRGWDEGKRACSNLRRQLRAEADAAMSLFYKGGKLEDYGFRVRPDLDRIKVHRALQALLGSWNVSHEQKEGTCALAIHHWCEPLSQEKAA